MPTVTRTVLFTDLADYTARISHADREGIRRILLEHEEAVRPIVERYGGKVVKNIGDSFLCLFPAATDALRGALEIQQALGDSNAIRVSVSTGDVEEIEGDAFGGHVNLAARILQKAPAGEIWFSLGTRVCMNEAEIPWEHAGRFRLKGIPDEQDCFRCVPSHKVIFPYNLESAVRTNRLTRVKPGGGPPHLAPDPVVMFEDFEPGSAALEDAIAALPLLDPAALFMATYLIPSDVRYRWLEEGRGLVIGTPEAIDAAIVGILEPRRRRASAVIDDSETMALDPRSLALLDLVICGLALPAVPFGEVVASYTYDLLASGAWVTGSPDAIARVEVGPEGVLLRALSSGISVNGRLVSLDAPSALSDSASIGTPAGEVIFRALHDDYAGVLVAESDMRLAVINGQTAELGRKPNPPGLAFPVREGQDNIRWCSGPRASRARKNGFTLDRVLAGRRQAAVRVMGSDVELVPLHDGCPTYVLRDRSLVFAENPVPLRIGDLVIAGTNVVGLMEPV